MKLSETFKRVFQKKEAIFCVLIMVVSCVLAFVFAKLEATRSVSTILQVVCFMAVLVASQQFSQIVLRVQEEGKNQKADKARRRR